MSILWEPTQERRESAAITRFARLIEGKYSLRLSDFSSLYRWSLDSTEEFWREVLDFVGVVYDGTPDVVSTSHAMPGTRWFPNVKLNFAENLLRWKDDREAFVFWGEDKVERRYTYRELYAMVSKLAQALSESGLSSGDRVAGFVPNMPEAAAAMLATTALGGIWSSCSPDFGEQGILDRFGQIEPRVLFTADGYFHKGTFHSSLEKVRRVAERLPSLERIVVLPYSSGAPNTNGIPRAVSLEEFLSGRSAEDIPFQRLPFDHPVYIMYSSGTTGKPKCIVHGAGGTLLEHLKELVLHTDITRDDRFFYQSTCGWMMWNWHMTGLATGATLLVYDGAPFHRDGRILFELAERERMSVFGTNAKYLAAVEKHGVVPANEFRLHALRTILSTGSPLTPESFDFVYRSMKQDVCLSSISGGTDILGCFALGCPVLPVYRGELQCRSLGLNVQVFDDQGRSIIGEKGELVCTAPFPSMPVSFWNDPDGARYRAAYFERFPGVWQHGDYVELTARETMIFHGRSDAVLNPGGIRIGTAEIYRQVETIPDIQESIVIGQEWDGDTRIVLFVKLQPGSALTDELADRIRRQIRSNASPFHVPKKIIAVPDIPRTRSGKIVELAVRDIVHGRPIKNIEALDNPEALEYFRGLSELEE